MYFYLSNCLYMKRFLKITAMAVIATGIFSSTSCELLNNGKLSEEEVAAGLKEALKHGSDSSTTRLHKQDGYLADATIKILLPQEAQTAVSAVDAIVPGLSTQLVTKINRAAEDAAIEAKPILWNAIEGLTIQDAFTILQGNDDAATVYLRSKTYDGLYNAFQPKIQNSLQTVGAQQLWTQFSNTYNNIPFVTPIPDNLAAHVTNKALDGLFVYVAKEELKIRTDVNARVTDLLKKVFAEQ